MLSAPIAHLASACSTRGSGQICGQKSAPKFDVVNCVGTFHIKRPPRVCYCNSSSAVCQEVSQINFCTAVSKDKTAEDSKYSADILFRLSFLHSLPVDKYVNVVKQERDKATDNRNVADFTYVCQYPQNNENSIVGGVS